MVKKIDFLPFMQNSFIQAIPNNKLSEFIVPTECKGDDGEIPEIESLLFEKNKIKLSFI